MTVGLMRVRIALMVMPANGCSVSTADGRRRRDAISVANRRTACYCSYI